MPTTLSCIGLDVAGLDELNTHLEAMPSEVVGRVGGFESVRFTDDSGARVVVVRDADDETVDLVPSFDARPGAVLGDLGPQGPVVRADVLDQDQTATVLAADLEQHRHLTGVVGGPLRAAVVALGVEMSVHADEAAFGASDASLLGEPDDGAGPGARPRFGARSFVSYGLFGDPAAAEPTAFLAGVVLDAETRTHGVTGQTFHVARLATVGFETTVCLPASAATTTPVAGNVVAGSCYLVLDVPTLWTVEPPRRRRRRR